MIRLTICLLLVALGAMPVAGAKKEQLPPDRRLPKVVQTPPVEAINAELLNAAAVEATRNGMASLFARLTAPDNHTGMVFPAVNTNKRIGSREVEVHGHWKVVDVPVYKDFYEQALVPQTDSYGNITGYVRRPVLKARKVIRVEKERRFFRDPDGPDVRMETRPVYEEGEADYVPRGLLGLNAMALYVMVKAGLAEDDRVIMFADELSRTVNEAGLPDHTWDLAWLTAAYATWPSTEYEPLLNDLLSKLIDGQITEGKAAGMWGPVCINYDLMARFLVIDLKLRPQMNELQDKLEKLGESNSNSTTARRTKAQLEKYQDLMQEVLNARKTCTTQGCGLMYVTRSFRSSDQYLLAPLPYYIYNRIAADMDCTSLAAFALGEAAQSKRLIDRTIRHQPAGNRLTPPIVTRKAVLDALKRLATAQQRDGGWDENNLVVVNHTFDRMGELGLGEVPYRGRLPELPVLETVQSNLQGAAATESLLKAAGERPPANYTASADRATERVGAMLEQIAAAPLRIARERWAYSSETDELDDLKDDGQVPTETKATSDPAAMPLGYITAPYASLRSAALLLDKSHPRLPEEADSLRRRITYRLVVTQYDDGQWHLASYNPAYTSSLLPMLDINRATALVARKSTHPNWKANSYWHPDRWRRYASMSREHRYHPPEYLYATLASLVFLTNQLDQPLSMEGAVILPPESPVEADAAGDDGEVAVAADDADEPAPAAEGEGAADTTPEAPDNAAPAEAQPVTPDIAANTARRINTALPPLLKHVQLKLDPESVKKAEQADQPAADE